MYTNYAFSFNLSEFLPALLWITGIVLVILIAILIADEIAAKKGQKAIEQKLKELENSLARMSNLEFRVWYDQYRKGRFSKYQTPEARDVIKKELNKRLRTWSDDILKHD